MRKEYSEPKTTSTWLRFEENFVVSGSSTSPGIGEDDDTEFSNY